MGITKAEADTLDTYICPNCQQKEQANPIAQKVLTPEDFITLLKIVRSLKVCACLAWIRCSVTRLQMMDCSLNSLLLMVRLICHWTTD